MIAFLSGVGLAAVGSFAASMENPFLIIFSAIAAVGVMVALGCWLLMDIQFSKSALIGTGFVMFKVIFIAITFFLLA